MTKVTVIGSGYVGLVTGACLSELGNDVVCMDVDAAKIATLQGGGMPIFEPGLLEMVRRNVSAERLSFTTDVKVAAEHGAIQFIAVGTPPDEDGSADLSYVLAAARNIGRSMTAFTVIVNKSTVPVGTANKVRDAVAQELAARGASIPFSVVSNPEFLKEGAAIDDFMRPGRIVVGADDDESVRVMRALYAPIQRNHNRLIVMDTRAAELTKYASNAMLATRISFMNELANLASSLGVDVESVRHGIGSDPRIGYDFLYAGCGYGGSCFPKDVKALIRTAEDLGHPMQVLHAVDAANELQKEIMARKVMARFGEDLRGKHFALWGLAFKPNTDDMRQAPSRTLIDALLMAGATITAYDPVAMPEARRIYEAKPALTFADTPMSALDLHGKAEGLLIVTEWKEFRAPNLDEMKTRLIHPIIIDGRNLYDPQLLRARGIEYIAIGR